MNDLPEVLERLTARLETLERRVASLENREAVAVLPAAPEPSAPAALEFEAEPSAMRPGGTFQVLGKALLGIAGAYVLRAVAESGALPKLAIAAVATIYAILWLVGAARLKSGEWLASIVYSGASALILAPMLWELTLRFKVLPAWAAAGVLLAFVIAASVLAWKRELTAVFWVGNATAAAAALGLAIATHDLMPFLLVLLLMVLISEYAAGCDHELSVRPLVALAADLSVCALLFVYSGGQAARAEYPAIPAPQLLLPGCLLFAIYAGSITIRTVILRQKITVFEIGQTMAALLLAACSVIFFVPGSGMLAVGMACLLLCVASYSAAFGLFEKETEKRNFTIFAGWSAGLLVAGSFLCLTGMTLTSTLSAAAVTAALTGVRLRRRTLEEHALFYLLAASFASGLPQYAMRAMAGTLPLGPGWGIWIAAGGAVACYAAQSLLPTDDWKLRAGQLISAALAICAVAALTVKGLLWIATLGITPEVHHIAFVRTFTMCSLALGLAYAGARWHRVELTRIAYAALALLAAKLLFEDLRHGHLEFIAGSIFLFAVTLITVPRLARTGQKI